MRQGLAAGAFRQTTRKTDVTSFPAWFFDLVLGDEFVLMVGMFLIIGAVGNRFHAAATRSI